VIALPAWLGSLGGLFFLLRICLRSLLSTLYVEDLRRLERVLVLGTSFCAAIFVGLMVTLVATCRLPNAVFNLALSIALIVQSSVGVVYSVVTHFVLSNLERLLRDVAANSGEREEFFHRYAARVALTRKCLVLFLTLFTCSTAPVGIVGLALGVFPMAWIATSLTIDASLGIFLAMTIFVERDGLTIRSVASSVVAVVQNSLRSIDATADSSSMSQRDKVDSQVGGRVIVSPPIKTARPLDESATRRSRPLEP